MTSLFPAMDGTALVDGPYRYLLTRSTGVESKRKLAFMGMNPSKATADIEDQTSRKWTTYARAWGFGSYVAVNAFAYMSTDPKQLSKLERQNVNVCGLNNREHLERVAREVDMFVVACGTPPWKRIRDVPDDSVQLCVTSPPYFNLRSYDDDGAWEGGDESCDHLNDQGLNKDFNARAFGKETVSGQRKQETRGKRPYRDVCGKCGARRVPKWVGGDDPECTHTASNPKQDHSRGRMKGTRGEQDANAASVKPQPRRCRKCGAERITEQIGLEETPQEYIAKMVEVFREVRRVLRPDGCLMLNLGDSYAGGGCGSRDAARWPKQSRNDHMPTHGKKNTGMKDKDQLGIPHRTYFALQDDGWYGRQDIVWSKDNATPSGVKDRCVSSHEYIFLLSKSKTYYFDNDALREPSVTEEGGWRKPRSVWCFPTTPSSIKHHAQFPRELPRRCILAATRPGDLVLDCFCGTGTTPLVAQELGRRWVAIELVQKYADIIQERTRTQIGLAL